MHQHHNRMSFFLLPKTSFLSPHPHHRGPGYPTVYRFSTYSLSRYLRPVIHHHHYHPTLITIAIIILIHVVSLCV